MGFSRQECWSGLPFPPPGDLPDPGIEPKSPMSPALGGGFSTPRVAWEARHELTWAQIPALSCPHLRQERQPLRALLSPYVK